MRGLQLLTGMALRKSCLKFSPLQTLIHGHGKEQRDTSPHQKEGVSYRGIYFSRGQSMKGICAIVIKQNDKLSHQMTRPRNWNNNRRRQKYETQPIDVLRWESTELNRHLTDTKIAY